MRTLSSPRLHVRQLVRVSAVALVAGLLQIMSVTPASAAMPFGDVNVVESLEPGRVHIRGWAIDPDDVSASVNIQIYFGDRAEDGYNLGPAKAYRPDVGSGDYHGFDTVLDVAIAGDYEWRVYANDAQGNPLEDTLLESGRVIVADANPVGSLDTISSKQDRRVSVFGWAGDPNDPSATVEVVVFVGGTYDDPDAERHIIKTGDARPDVAAATGYGPKAGFSATFTASRIGRQGVHVYLVNHPGSPGSNTHLGGRTVTVYEDALPPPTGHTVAARAVKKKSKLRIDVGPDSASASYRVVIQRKVGKKWRKVSRVRTRGDSDVVVVNLRRGNYRVVLPKSAQGPALRSGTVRLKR